ncbi:sugar phosphate isomerase/epimerase family protein [Fundicoccus sp. Sow4_H7]|uniref:sugar phosphate isomerase/epimerase family protein n=1 Tax=Fundicoccus sp. Sow4_H7 TaxID=3438784 RepID=UPI003F936451
MFGLCSVTFSEKAIAEVVAIAKEAGLEGIEWSAKAHVRPREFEEAQAALEATQAAGLAVASYGSYYKVGSFADFGAILETATILQTDIIRVWAGEKGSLEVSAKERQKIVDDAIRIAELAKEKNKSIHFEYHSQTLTDTPESAEQLMAEVSQPNVFLYWQPAESLTVEERIASFRKLLPMVSTLHVFHWQDFNHRFPLAEGAKEWQAYLAIVNEAKQTPRLLFEFVRDDNPDQLTEDVHTLKSWLN